MRRGLTEPVGDKLLDRVSEVRDKDNLRIPGGKAMGKVTLGCPSSLAPNCLQLASPQG